MTIRYTSGVDIIEHEKEMTRFIRSLKELDCTSILLSEMTQPDAYTVEQFLAHGVIFMHNFLTDSNMVRAVQVIKMRGTRHDCNMRKLQFTDDGLIILPEKITM